MKMRQGCHNINKSAGIEYRSYVSFSKHFGKGNTEKCLLIMTTDQSVNFQRGGLLIEGSDCEKLLGVKIEYKLKFDEHVKTLCSKANNKLKALGRATPYMNAE